MESYGDQEPRIAKAECNAISMIEKLEVTKQADSRKRVVFYNLRNNEGKPLSHELRIYNLD